MLLLTTLTPWLTTAPFKSPDRAPLPSRTACGQCCWPAVPCRGFYRPLRAYITAPPLLRTAAAAAAAPCVPLTPAPLQVHGGGDSTATVGGWEGSCAELEKVSDAT